MKTNYFFLVMALCCMSCAQKTSKEQAGSNTEIPNDTSTYYGIKNNIIPVDFDKPEVLSVFDYFKSVELIPLETGEDVLIGQLQKIIHYQDRYYTLDRQQHIVHVFDETGKFVFKIDRRGQGPGEYPSLDDIHISRFTDHLELLCAMGFVYEYDLSGEFIEMTRVTNEYLRAVHECISLDKNTILFFAAFHHPYRLVYYDRHKQQIIHEDFEESDILGAMFNYSSFYRYNDNWYFYRPFCQEVYKLEKNRMKTAYTWDFGKFNRDFRETHFSVAAQNNPYTRFDEISAQIPYWLLETGENNRFVISRIKINGEFANLIYDKSIQQSKYIPHFTESVDILPLTVTNEYVLSYCNPSELEQYVTEDMLDDESRKVFNELIHADANPVILKYHFK
ncbi:MAG: 6-bladed beta-propeller [Prevotellaceae bacterium]|nr:6-bladed beta-propeller [Prevotellaceae bacterium]